jgi:hypothetical protein
MRKAESPSDADGFGTCLLDAQQVAALLNVSEGWVWDHSATKEPRLPALKFGPGKTAIVRYHPADIQDFIECQREQAYRRSPQARWRN